MSESSFKKSPRPTDSEEIELQAAEWLVRQDHGLDAQQQQEFERWRAADARHASHYKQLTETWRALDAVPAYRVPLPRRRRTSYVWWAAASLAAAAAIVAGLFSVGYLPMTPSPVRHAATPIGGMESVKLQDGSIVRLNTASEISVDFSPTERRITLRRGEASFDVTKDPSRPFIVRVGEVDVHAVGTVFNVRHGDAAIEVLVVEGRVRVEDADSNRVTSMAAPSAPSTSPANSGSSASSGNSSNEPLAVAPTAEASASGKLLRAGQRAVIVRAPGVAPAEAKVAEVAPEESARALAWHSGQVEFSNEPLANIAAEFNRYNRHRLVIDDPRLAEQRFGGKFPANDFAALVRLLELNYSVQVEQRENETVLRGNPSGR
jgi:transmembrane sensor